MFSYFGSKSKIVDLYPAPKYNLIIEPFAGSARYALKYFDRDVILIDSYDIVIKIWKYLQQASPKDILGLPNLKHKESIDSYNLTEGERLLLGFLIARGSRRPVKTVQAFCDLSDDKKRIASSLFKIKHWRFINGDYNAIVNCEATWFIDPPYQNIGKSGYNVVERGQKINYSDLSAFCKNRKGQSIVCEITTADWLPFKPIKKISGLRLKTTEAIWLNNDNLNLELF